ncbi:MAG TPA: hypothetical protein VJ826_16650 [Candidatus Polarisedimenticolaceae bacterium]|nr:hypothetical protein [Candidatus Polarisedimenticolaceae bacterium]
MGTTKKKKKAAAKANPTATYDADRLLEAAEAVLKGVIAARAGKATRKKSGKTATLTKSRFDKNCPPPEVIEVSRVDKNCPPPRQLTDLAANNNRKKRDRIMNRIQDVIILLDTAKDLLDESNRTDIGWDT